MPVVMSFVFGKCNSDAVVGIFFSESKGWFPLDVNCGRGVKNSLFLYLVLCASAHIKLNRETKNFSRHASNLRLMETSLNSQSVDNLCIILSNTKLVL